MTDRPLLPALPPPRFKTTIFAWLRQNLFFSPFSTVVTVILLFVLASIVVPFFNWAVVQASWFGSDRRVCTTLEQGGMQPNGWHGACWAFVQANFSQVLYGNYSFEERWRVDLMAVIVLVVNVPLLIPAVGYKVLNAFFSLFAVPVIGYCLLYGGVFGLPTVSTQVWGGLMVTLVVAYTSITLSLPLGTLLALGRRSDALFIRWLSIAFIETVRGIPLITILFIASILFPLFMPSGMNFDKLLRALLAIALFTSVYIAEVIRGGLQAIPISQYEGARSLGFRYWGTTLFIILPQVYRLVIPGIVNTLIGMFKETSLIYVISMFDLLGIIQQLTLQAAWITPQTPNTAYVFAGLVFWFFCFVMSRYGHFIEQRLDRINK